MAHTAGSLKEILDRTPTGTVTKAYLAMLDERIRDKQGSLAVAQKQIEGVTETARGLEREINALCQITHAIRRSRVQLPQSLPEAPEEEN